MECCPSKSKCCDARKDRLDGLHDGFIKTPAGNVPRVKTHYRWYDKLGALKMRLGVNRGDYRVTPGLYAVGDPTQDSEVFVTANYKLSFDILRREIAGLNAWILVLDTHGINVWCAAGKGTFGTEELVERIKFTEIDKIVKHKELIVPQLGAVGIATHEVVKLSGFRVKYGPVRARDIKTYLESGKKVTDEMRAVTFTTWERFELTPLEISAVLRKSIWVFLAVFLISGVGPHLTMPQVVLYRGLIAFAFYAVGVIAGAFVAPVMLPWIPFRAFSVKGFITGALCGLALRLVFEMDLSQTVSMTLLAAAISSYLTLNFTGSTPYTSPTGVEWEMRRAIPMQVVGLIVSAALWVASAFNGA